MEVEVLLMNDLLTLVEVATRLRVPEATLRYWRTRGEGPTGFKVGRRVVYRATTVDQWLAELERKSSERESTAGNR